VNGKASVGWRQGLPVEGSFDVSQIEPQAAGAAAAPARRMSGKFSRKTVFSQRAHSQTNS